jgi:hypothetical protein
MHQNQVNLEINWDKQMKQFIQKRGVIAIFTAIENVSKKVQWIMISIFHINEAKIDRNPRSLNPKMWIYRKEVMIKTRNPKNLVSLLNLKIAKRAKMFFKISKGKKKKKSKKLLLKNCRK